MTAQLIPGPTEPRAFKTFAHKQKQSVEVFSDSVAIVPSVVCAGYATRLGWEFSRDDASQLVIEINRQTDYEKLDKERERLVMSETGFRDGDDRIRIVKILTNRKTACSHANVGYLLQFQGKTEEEVHSPLLVPGLGVQLLSRTKQIAVVLETADDQPD